MATNAKVDEIEAEALTLSSADRAQLVSRLVASLDEHTDQEIELAWVEEADRRFEEALANPASVEAAAVAFQRARDALR